MCTRRRRRPAGYAGEMAAIHGQIIRMSPHKGAEAMLPESDRNKVQHIRELRRGKEGKMDGTEKSVIPGAGACTRLGAGSRFRRITMR